MLLIIWVRGGNGKIKAVSFLIGVYSLLNFGVECHWSVLFVSCANWYICICRSKMAKFLIFFLPINVWNLNLTISCLRGSFFLYFSSFCISLSVRNLSWKIKTFLVCKLRMYWPVSIIVLKFFFSFSIWKRKKFHLLNLSLMFRTIFLAKIVDQIDFF